MRQLHISQSLHIAHWASILSIGHNKTCHSIPNSTPFWHERSARPTNNSDLSGILAQFAKIFCEKQLFRLNFLYDFTENIACFSSILIAWQKMLEKSVGYRGKFEEMFAVLTNEGRFAQNFLPAQIFSGN